MFKVIEMNGMVDFIICCLIWFDRIGLVGQRAEWSPYDKICLTKNCHSVSLKIYYFLTNRSTWKFRLTELVD